MDVQRTASKDETGTACTRWAPNKQCIGLCILLILMSYLIRTQSLNNFPNQMTSERTLVVRPKCVSKCCYDNITCCKCNRTSKPINSQIDDLTKCSMNVNQNSKFLTTENDSELSVNCR